MNVKPHYLSNVKNISDQDSKIPNRYFWYMSTADFFPVLLYVFIESYYFLICFIFQIGLCCDMVKRYSLLLLLNFNHYSYYFIVQTLRLILDIQLYCKYNIFEEEKVISIGIEQLKNRRLICIIKYRMHLLSENLYILKFLLNSY